MKEPYFIILLLIPRPKTPRRGIDVYLHSLIDELKELCDNGVQVYDMFRGKYFCLHAVVM